MRIAVVVLAVFASACTSADVLRVDLTPRAEVIGQGVPVLLDEPKEPYQTIALVEVAVDSVISARRAVELGADRLELCQALEVGGLTPSLGLVGAVRAAVGVPLFIMIRPRPGAFEWGAADTEVMLRDIGLVRELGADGVVGGALTAVGEIDLEVTEQLVARAGSMPFTFHRAFDLVADWRSGLAQLRALGARRVLTAGGRGTAFEGRARLAEYVAQAVGGPIVVAGGGIRAATVGQLLAGTGLREIHLAGVVSVPEEQTGFGQTSLPDEVRVKAVIEAIGGPLGT